MKYHLLPAFENNYLFVVTDETSNKCCVIDPGDAKVINQFLEKECLKLETILVTHQHRDHCGGVRELAQKHECEVFAPQLHRTDFDFSSSPLSGSEVIEILGTRVQVMSTPGHTAGHLSYFFSEYKWIFCGDVLFGLGCGRIFPGGSLQKQYISLQILKSLPDTTKVFCAHEYTEKNKLFCEQILGLDLTQYRFEIPSVPLELGRERAMNPFLTARTFEEFSKIREMRDQFS